MSTKSTSVYAVAPIPVVRSNAPNFFTDVSQRNKELLSILSNFPVFKKNPGKSGINVSLLDGNAQRCILDFMKVTTGPFYLILDTHGNENTGVIVDEAQSNTQPIDITAEKFWFGLDPAGKDYKLLPSTSTANGNPWKGLKFLLEERQKFTPHCTEVIVIFAQCYGRYFSDALTKLKGSSFPDVKFEGLSYSETNSTICRPEKNDDLPGYLAAKYADHLELSKYLESL